MSRLLALLLLMLVSAGVSLAQPSPPALHVQGNQLFDQAGNPVQLRGVNQAGGEYMCTSPTDLVFDGPANQAGVDALKSWQINIVRLPLNEQCWLGVNGLPVWNGAAAYQQEVVRYANLLTANGVYVIIDLQWANSGANRATGLIPMPDADHAPAFWASVAATFKGNGMVLFDLFNEPFPDNNGESLAAWACVRDGGTCPGVSYNTVGMQSLVNTVRATGATNVILVPGLQYTSNISQWLTYRPNDPLNNLAASWHIYNFVGCDRACWDSRVAPVLASAPVIAGEIGENDCGHTFIDPLMDWLDAHGGHYLGWQWNTYDCGSAPALISNYNGTPTNFGVGLRNHLFARAGVPTPTPVPLVMFSQTYPFGINVGSSTSYTANDGTVYYADSPTAGLASDTRYFSAYSTTQPISGTSSPTLFQTGRSGAYGNWTINVPNGMYQVTLGAAPTSQYGTGEYGQDQYVAGQKVGTCVWSNTPDYCPHQGTPPVLGEAVTVAYTVNVFDQQLTIQSAAAFGDNRQTILSMIRVARADVPTQLPTAQPTETPTVTPTETPTVTPTETPTPAPTPCRPARFCRTPTIKPTPTLTPTPLPSPTPTATAVLLGCEVLVRKNGVLAFQYTEDTNLCPE